MSFDGRQGLLDDIRRELDAFGISCDEGRAHLLLIHLELVMEKNKTINLTRITNLHEAVTLHVVDSLLPLACASVSSASLSPFVDIGTGAGFPGTPLGIMTDASGLLIDSVGKKVSAVSEFIDVLGLSDKLVAKKMRAEELDSSMRHSYAMVSMRAVAKSNVLIEYAEPFLQPGGILLIEKARPDQLELHEAGAAARICGMENVSRETFELRDGLGHREILIYKKVRRASIKLPRKSGQARQSPLGSSE